MTDTTPRLKLDRFQVAFGDEDDETTWSVLTVPTRPKDTTQAFDLFGRHKEWGAPDRNPHRLAMATVYYALRRRGEYTGNFDQFIDEVLDVEKVDEEQVDPTETATGD